MSGRTNKGWLVLGGLTPLSEALAFTVHISHPLANCCTYLWVWYQIFNMSIAHLGLQLGSRLVYHLCCFHWNKISCVGLIRFKKWGRIWGSLLHPSMVKKLHCQEQEWGKGRRYWAYIFFRNKAGNINNICVLSHIIYVFSLTYSFWQILKSVSFMVSIFILFLWLCWSFRSFWFLKQCT